MLRKEKVVKEKVVTEIGGDRRNRYRYDLELNLQYKVLRRHEVCQSGAGKTVNLSGGGLAVAIDDVVTPGSVVELAIAWPVMLNKSCPLKLVVTGKVVRSTGAITAVRMERYEFRTQAMRTFKVQAAGYLS